MHPRNWVEISRGALRRNLDYVRSRLDVNTVSGSPAPDAEAALGHQGSPARPSVKPVARRSRAGPRAGQPICAVVKADAYGHGAVECARVFLAGGVGWLAVTSPEEGARLRQAIPGQARILVLAGFARGDVATLIEHQLTPAVWDPEQIGWLASGLGRLNGDVPFPVHVKFESGMGRLGLTPAQENGMTAALRAEPRLRVEAVFSHLACAESDGDASEVQHRRFMEAARRWAPEAGTHLLNSEGALRHAAWSGCFARIGLALYGYSVEPEAAAKLEPALSWKTRVVAIKDLPAGHGLGYGATFRAPHAMRIAVIAAGYADGYRRQFWPGARVLVGGRQTPVVGNVSMDLTTVDITQLPVPPNLGDEVTLLGAANGERVTAADLAALAHTIPYEILCGLSARVERHYRE